MTKPTTQQEFVHNRWRNSPSRAGVISSILVRHVSIILLPVMIVTLAVVLEMQPVLGLLLWAYPLGLAIAVFWTRAWYTSTIAAVCVREEAAAVLTFSELARGQRPTWHRVTDASRSESGLSATIGRSPYRFTASDWDSLEQLASALEQALAHGKAARSAETPQ